MYLEDKEKEWMIVIVYEEREIIKKIKKIWYFNEM